MLFKLLILLSMLLLLDMLKLLKPFKLSENFAKLVKSGKTALTGVGYGMILIQKTYPFINVVNGVNSLLSGMYI